MTLSLPAQSSIAQKSEADTAIRQPIAVSDVQVLPPRAGFFNITDSTYFAIPKYRVERLLRDAMLSDSLQVIWKRDLEVSAVVVSFWQSAAYMAGVVALVEFVILIIQ